MPETPADLSYELQEKYGLCALTSTTTDPRFNFVLYGDKETVERLHNLLTQYGPEIADVITRGEGS